MYRSNKVSVQRSCCERATQPYSLGRGWGFYLPHPFEPHLAHMRECEDLSVYGQALFLGNIPFSINLLDWFGRNEWNAGVILKDTETLIIVQMSVSGMWATAWQNKQMTCPHSKDQPGHPHSLISVFAVLVKNHWSLATHKAHSEDSDQTGRMPMLIWAFAGRTGHFVCFVMWWLRYI